MLIGRQMIEAAKAGDAAALHQMIEAGGDVNERDGVRARALAASERRDVACDRAAAYVLVPCRPFPRRHSSPLPLSAPLACARA